MSATYEPSAFSTYFNPKTEPPVLFVGVRKFPVQIYQMEEILKCTDFTPQTLGVSEAALARPAG